MNLYRQQIDHVVIPPIQNPLTLLCESFDPLRMSDTCSGVDIYCAVRQIFFTRTMSQIYSNLGLFCCTVRWIRPIGEEELKIVHS